MKEEWKPIEGFGRYSVSNTGRVIGPRGLMTPSWAKGYHIVGIYIGRKRYYKTIHSLVAMAFIGPRPVNHQVNHKDGIKINNAVTNLEYVTDSENKQHAVRIGLGWVGTKNGSAKLTDDDIRLIRASYIPRTMSADKLAKIVGVSKRMVLNIIHNKNWVHV